VAWPTLAFSASPLPWHWQESIRGILTNLVGDGHVEVSDPPTGLPATFDAVAAFQLVPAARLLGSANPYLPIYFKLNLTADAEGRLAEATVVSFCQNLLECD